MISLARVSAKMGRTYYTQDSYYTKDASIEHSEWFGKGATSYGLSGQVDSQVFQKLLDEYGAKSRVAIDLTFSAPKSVSLACLVGGDSNILEAHKKAVNTALEVVEKRFSWSRVGSEKNRNIEVGGNILCAKFLHDVSRTKDPQLHTHCVVFNKVQCADQKWRSLHNDGIFNNSKLLGLIYQNELAHEVKKLGYEIQVNQNGTFELAGYSAEQLQAFSKRTKQIEALNCPTKKQERVEKLLDRPAKGKSVPREVLQEQWGQECNKHKVVHPVPKTNIGLSSHIQNQIAHTNINDAIEHVTQNDVRFKKEQIEKYALQQNLGTISLDSYKNIFSDLKKDGSVIEYQQNMFTTKSALLVEERMLNMISVGKNKFESIKNSAKHIASEHTTLTSGQKNALITSLSSKDQFIAWQGVAGAGKTYALDILRNIAVENGYTVKGFAQSAEASQVLCKEAKIPSQTVASLLTQNSTPKYSSQINNYKNKEIWIVDEAGLLGAVECTKLMENAVHQNARVVFVGDTKQMPAISAGNPFLLMQTHGVQTAHLEQSLRQKKENLKQAVDSISKNNIHSGLKRIMENIYEVKDFDQKIQRICDEYSKLSSDDQNKTLILSSSNYERAQITEKIRDELKQNGLLNKSVTINQCVPKHKTAAELRSIWNYEPNDVLVFHRDHPKWNIHKTQSYSIDSIDHKNNTLTIRAQNDSVQLPIEIQPCIGGFTTYTQRKLEISKGDKVKCTKNDKYLGIRNGQDFTVEQTSHNEVTLKSQNGKRIRLSTDHAQHLDYNYVHTVYSSQGKTCDRVIISENQNFGKEMLYVALSRAKHDVVIISQNKEQFLQANQKSNQKLSATDLVKESKNHVPKLQTESKSNNYYRSIF